MGTANELLIDALGRVNEGVRDLVAGRSADVLAQRPAPGANTVAWLVWHLTRVEDDHVAAAAGREQVWTAEGWVERFGLPFGVGATGYGQTEDEVGAVVADGDLMAGYQDAVHAAVVDYVAGLTEGDWARVVDERWDPPVTLAVRLVSVANDMAQHLGQAAYARGVLERRG